MFPSTRTPGSNPPAWREIVVYLPVEGNHKPPLTLAQELTAVLQSGRAEIGVDLLTGGAEVRFYYAAATLTALRDWIDTHLICADIETR